MSLSQEGGGKAGVAPSSSSDHSRSAMALSLSVGQPEALCLGYSVIRDGVLDLVAFEPGSAFQGSQ
jgi:hypothetical protein